jgi:hypothetical protein
MSPSTGQPATRVEVFLGRLLAACVHPVAAWRAAVRPMRALVVGGYFVAGFVAVLIGLTLRTR